MKTLICCIPSVHINWVPARHLNNFPIRDSLLVLLQGRAEPLGAPVRPSPLAPRPVAVVER